MGTSALRTLFSRDGISVVSSRYPISDILASADIRYIGASYPQPVHIVSFFTVDTSLLWILFARPSGVHIGEFLILYILVVRGKNAEIYVPRPK